MAAWQRAMIGGLGGLTALLVKYIGQDHNFAMEWLSTGDPKFQRMLIGYAVLAPILIFLGSVVAWVSEEANSMKLLAMGMAAPALITTWAGGATPASPPAATPGPGRAGFFQLSPVGTAYAGGQGVEIAQANAIKQGVELFFGVGKAEPRFWVVVGSHENRQDAEAQAAAINRERPGIGAFVGKQMPGNPYYPVIIGEYVPRAEGNRLVEVAKRLSSVSDAYLSAYADRRP